MSAIHVLASTTTTGDDGCRTGVIVVDTVGDDGLVNLDLGRAVPAVPEAGNGERWVSLTPGEARALAAALEFYAREAEQ